MMMEPDLIYQPLPFVFPTPRQSRTCQTPWCYSALPLGAGSDGGGSGGVRTGDKEKKMGLVVKVDEFVVDELRQEQGLR